MNISEARNKLVMSEINIELDEGIVLVLREANVTEAGIIDKEETSEGKIEQVFKLCFKSISVTKDDGSPAGWKDAVDLVASSVTVAGEVLQAWSNANPLASRRKKKKS